MHHSFLSWRRLGLALLLSLIAPWTQAESIGLTISAESAEFSYGTGGDYTDLIDWGASIFYNSIEAEDGQTTGHAMVTLNMETALEGDSSSRMLFALGGEIYLLTLDRISAANEGKETETDANAAGISLSGKIGYLFPTTVPSVAYVSGHISPNIINTGKVETMRRFSAMYELSLSQAAIFQLGYRNYYAGFDQRYDHLGKQGKTFENNVVGGIKLRF